MSYDPSYRYRREVLRPTIIAKNGGTTVIPSKQIDALAHDLNRGRSAIISVIKSTFGVSVREGARDGSIHVRKSIGPAELDEAIEQYILAAVVCRVCGNPETDVKRGCLACGTMQ